MFRFFFVISCKSCDKLFWDLKKMQEHKPHKGRGCKTDRSQPRTRKVTKKARVCEQCGKTFSSGSNLKTHQYMIHLPEDMKTVFECFICHATFPERYKLRRHIRRHNPNLVKCNVCDAMLSTQNFARHAKSHSDVCPFSCSFCEKKFKFAIRLKVRLRL